MSAHGYKRTIGLWTEAITTGVDYFAFAAGQMRQGKAE